MPKAISTTLAAIPAYWKSLRISLYSLWLRWLVTATIGSFGDLHGLRGTALDRCGELPARDGARCGCAPARQPRPLEHVQARGRTRRARPPLRRRSPVHGWRRRGIHAPRPEVLRPRSGSRADSRDRAWRSIRRTHRSRALRFARRVPHGGVCNRCRRGSAVAAPPPPRGPYGTWTADGARLRRHAPVQLVRAPGCDGA